MGRTWQHAPTYRSRQPFLSQSAKRGSHMLVCNGVRLTSQLKGHKAGQPARVIPYIDCAMLSQFFAYCRDSRVCSYNITVLNSYNCQWRMAGQPTQPAKDILYIMFIAMLSQVVLLLLLQSRRIFCIFITTPC